MRKHIGEVDTALLADWCAQWIGTVPDRVLFQRGNLSVVVGLQMRDGQQVVVKLRPPDDRIAGCVAVQRHLAECGFPCRRPLAGPSPMGGATVTAEAMIPDGTPLEHPAGAHARLAALLADLVRLAPAPSEVPSWYRKGRWLQSSQAGLGHRRPRHVSPRGGS